MDDARVDELVEPDESPETIASARTAEAADEKAERLLRNGLGADAFAAASLAVTIRRSLFERNPTRYGSELASSLYYLARAIESTNPLDGSAEAVLEEAAYLKEQHAPGTDVHAKLLFALGETRYLRNEMPGALLPWTHLVEEFAETTSLEIAELVMIARSRVITIIGADSRKALDIASDGVAGARVQIARNVAFAPVLARSLSQLGEVASRRTRHREALTHHEEARELLESLPVRDPVALAEMSVREAFSHLAAKSWASAIASAETALQSLGEVDARTSYEHRQLEGFALEYAGFASEGLGKRSDAQQFFESAIRTYESLDPTDETYRRCIRIDEARARLYRRGFRLLKASRTRKRARQRQQTLDASVTPDGALRLPPLRPAPALLERGPRSLGT
jgi:tetratricopeptide (TPR) repeat protein